jgi:hypothetical protein
MIDRVALSCGPSFGSARDTCPTVDFRDRQSCHILYLLTATNSDRLTVEMENRFTVNARYFFGVFFRDFLEGHCYDRLNGRLREGEKPVKSVSGHGLHLGNSSECRSLRSERHLSKAHRFARMCAICEMNWSIGPMRTRSSGPAFGAAEIHSPGSSAVRRLRFVFSTTGKSPTRVLSQGAGWKTTLGLKSTIEFDKLRIEFPV